MKKNYFVYILFFCTSFYLNSQNIDISNCDISDDVVQCQGDYIDVINSWNFNNVSDLENCATGNSITISFDFDPNNFVFSCGNNGNTGEISVIYTLEDANNNVLTVVKSLEIIDTTPPVITSFPNDLFLNCLEDLPALSASDIEAFDDCSAIEILFTETINNEGTGCPDDMLLLNRTYTVIDVCGNRVEHVQRIFIENTVSPILENCDLDSFKVVECKSPQENEAFAIQWNNDMLLTLQNCATNNCNPNNEVTVTSNFDWNNLQNNCGTCGELIVTFTISDVCSNVSVYTATLSFNKQTNCNDICTDGVILSSDTSVVGSTFGATQNTGQSLPSCATNNAINDVWYIVDQDSDTELSVNVETETEQNIGVAIYPYNCNQLQEELGCLFQSGGGELTVNATNGAYLIRVWTENDNQTDFNITASSQTLSLTNAKNDNINFYPNPVENELIINSKNKISEIEVYNVLGKKVLNTTPKLSNYTLDVESLNSGIYFVKIKIQNKLKTIKIIKD